MICPPDRATALQCLYDFLPRAVLYARDRNHVADGHPGVSKLSAAIRHRVITEEEVVVAILEKHRFSRVEKFIQEVYWRSYWKSWLSLRPQVWAGYQTSLSSVHNPAAERVEHQDSGNRIIDHFSNELVTTGYLHNHVRMWFAAWWIHEARLPWELGADFFMRHLLDADPASNTLSWRWVAGLQTPGKTYLARRSNLEKYLSPSLQSMLSDGLSAFENPKPFLPEQIEKPVVIRPTLPEFKVKAHLASGIWIHSEDLCPETSPLSTFQPRAARVIDLLDSQDSPVRQTWRSAAREDAAIRATRHWGFPVAVDTTEDIATTLLCWAQSHQIEQIIAIRPEVGPLNDHLIEIQAALENSNIHLALVDRPGDLKLRPLATRGFFQFWEKIRDQYSS